METPTPEELQALIATAPEPGRDPEAEALKVFRSKLHLAVSTICDVAEAGTHADKTKFDAAKYIVERCLGKISDRSSAESVIDKYYKEAEMYANEGKDG